MNIRKGLLLLVMLSIFLFKSADAVLFEKPEEGMKLYAGISAGGYATNVEGSDGTNGGSLGLLIGFEEYNWAFEYKAFVLRTTEDIQDKTSDLLSAVSVSYRMLLEDEEQYIKLKAGALEFGKGPGSGGPTAGVGYGWRIDRRSRIELEYVYAPREVNTVGNTIDIGVHMINLQYMFGGSDPNYSIF